MVGHERVALGILAIVCGALAVAAGLTVHPLMGVGWVLLGAGLIALCRTVFRMPSGTSRLDKFLYLYRIPPRIRHRRKLLVVCLWLHTLGYGGLIIMLVYLFLISPCLVVWLGWDSVLPSNHEHLALTVARAVLASVMLLSAPLLVVGRALIWLGGRRDEDLDRV